MDTLYFSDTIVHVPHLMGVDLPFFLLIGPLIYLYTHYLITAPSRWEKRNGLHLLPFVGFWLYLTPFFLSSGAEKLYQYQLLDNEEGAFHIILEIIWVAAPLLGLVYVGLTLLRIRAHQQTIKQTYSSIEAINLNWLRVLVNMIGGL